MNRAPSTKLRLKANQDLRLSDAVYETLLDAILSGRLETGQIVSEVALAQKLQVSRTPVHDALRQLAKDGLVRQEMNRRAVVAKFTAQDVYDIFEMRKLLEGEAARLAATRMDGASREELRAVMRDLAANLQAPDWVARWTDFDDQFHTAIAKAAGSNRLAHDISRYRTLHRGFNRISTNVEVLQKAMAEHATILDALDAGDSRAARVAMVQHIQEWQSYFMRHVER